MQKFTEFVVRITDRVFARERNGYIAASAFVAGLIFLIFHVMSQVKVMTDGHIAQYDNFMDGNYRVIAALEGIPDHSNCAVVGIEGLDPLGDRTNKRIVCGMPAHLLKPGTRFEKE